MRQALEMALEALQHFRDTGTRPSDLAMSEDAITAIKEALAQPVSSHGNAEDLYIEMNKHLNCPHCGGSGHVDDVAQPEQIQPSVDLNTHQPEQEPVAFICQGNVYMADDVDEYCTAKHIPLYTAPPQRKPLTYDMAKFIAREFPRGSDDWACKHCHPESEILKDGFVCVVHRAIEAAHGIKE